jgi:hypothetical protein
MLSDQSEEEAGKVTASGCWMPDPKLRLRFKPKASSWESTTSTLSRHRQAHSRAQYFKMSSPSE